MASLLVNLHEVVESYIKKAKDRDIAEKIGSEVLERSRQVIKKYKFTPEDACLFHVAELYPMLSRELHRLLKIIHRRMKTSTVLSHPWSIRVIRNMPKELFELLRQTILTGNYGILARKTRCSELLRLSDFSTVIKRLKHVINHAFVSVDETQILFKSFKNGSQCKAIIVDDHPLVIKYSKTLETVQFCLNYGCWNAFGIAQHVL